MESSKNNIEDSILAKYLDGSATEQESAEVESWIADHPENQQVFDHFSQIWFQSQAVGFNAEISFDKKAAFRQVLNRIEKDAGSGVQRQKPGKLITFPSFFVRAAAVLAIGIGTYFVVRNFLPSNSEVLLTATNESMEILLPDSSIINLNAEGEIKYDENFTADRKISLTGEAFFEVKKQNNKSFIVRADDLEVKVLGTSFYIIAFENDSLIEVGVKTGTVRVAQISGKESVILKANEMAVYNKATQSFSKSGGYSNNKLFWKTAVLEFNEQPLYQVLSTLGEVYDKEIVFRQSELENCNFTGRFKNASLEEILGQLQLSFDIKVTMSEQVIITGKACAE
ncbi:MAG: FecR domain-containing protein [Saprospiraceae bacterium]